MGCVIYPVSFDKRLKSHLHTILSENVGMYQSRQSIFKSGTKMHILKNHHMCFSDRISVLKLQMILDLT